MTMASLQLCMQGLQLSMHPFPSARQHIAITEENRGYTKQNQLPLSFIH